MTGRTILCAIALLVGAGCGSHVASTSAPPATRPPVPIGPRLLAQFDHGVGVVSQGSADPLWTDPAAVAALDGSAVFSIRRSPAGDQLARIDPDTGTAVSSWPLTAGAASIGAVAPGGRWVVLTDREAGYSAPEPRPSTKLFVFDAVDGRMTYQLDLSGDLRPEAFSVNGSLVFALDYRGDHYRVETIELATSMHYDTASRDKAVEREDMHGNAVRGVLSRDHTLLATLYRNPGDDDEPAFVHILDLRNGWAYCADLPAPFGSDAEHADRIELTPAGTALVTAGDGSRVADIHIEEVHEPGDTPVTIEYRDGTTVAGAPAYGRAPGFASVIAPLR